MSEPAAPSRESELRAARFRALGILAITAGLSVSGYLWFRSSYGIPGACKSSADCDGLGAECLHAPTGAYCTHSCNRDADCDPGTHCEIPPWENGATRALCIHDSNEVGK